MDTAKYADTLADMTDDPYRCELCRGPLADDEPWVCSACAIDALEEPSDDVKMRAWEMTARVFAGDWSVIGLASIVAALVFSAGMLLTHDAQAQDTHLTAPGQINGRVYEWPAIGTDAYSQSCSIVRWWEDGSAVASCWEDGAAYTFDPEDHEWTPMSEAR